jgi:hypothetical protein
MNHQHADEIDRNEKEAILSSYIKEVRTKNELPQSLFDDIETIIRDYCFYPALRHGDDVRIDGLTKPISWSFNNDFLDPNTQVTLCVKKGREWVDDRLLDEVPVELLLHLLKLIKEVRPLQDQRPPIVYDETKGFLDAKHQEKTHNELYKNLKWLNFPPHSSKMRREQLQ